MLTHDASPGQAYLQPVLPVESEPLSVLPKRAGPPGASSPDMGRVWEAAIKEDASPELVTRGKTGTFGGGLALTFDDGPQRRITPKILDTLKKRHLKVTFFVLGRQVKKNPELLRRIVAEGHTLGNHTYDHADLSTLNANQMRRELQSTQRAVDDALGYHYPLALMRPPYGDPYFTGASSLPAFRRVVREQELFPVMWTIDPSDYLYRGHPEGIVRGIRRVARARHIDRQGKRDEVLLLHDNQRQTTKALPKILYYYEGEGRKFTSVDELLADKYLDP